MYDVHVHCMYVSNRDYLENMSNGKEGSMYVYTCTCIVSVARRSCPLSQGVLPVRPAGVLFRVGFKSVHLEDVCFGC